MLTTEQVPQILRICYVFKKHYNTSRPISILGNNIHSQPLQQMQLSSDLHSCMHTLQGQYTLIFSVGGIAAQKCSGNRAR